MVSNLSTSKVLRSVDRTVSKTEGVQQRTGRVSHSVLQASLLLHYKQAYPLSARLLLHQLSLAKCCSIAFVPADTHQPRCSPYQGCTQQSTKAPADSGLQHTCAPHPCDVSVQRLLGHAHTFKRNGVPPFRATFGALLCLFVLRLSALVRTFANMVAVSAAGHPNNPLEHLIARVGTPAPLTCSTPQHGKTCSLHLVAAVLRCMDLSWQRKGRQGSESQAADWRLSSGELVERYSKPANAYSKIALGKLCATLVILIVYCRHSRG